MEMITMRRVVVLLFAFTLVAAACSGSSSGDGADTAEVTDPGDGSSSADDADGPTDDGLTEDDSNQAGGGGGGGTEQGLVEALGLPECPIGAQLDADGPIEIVFWHPYTALVEAAMDDLASAFNAGQDAIVVRVEAQGSYGELLSKYRESINFDSLPDIAIFDSQAVRDVIDSQTVLPAQSCIEADDFPLDNIDAAARANYSLDGALYPASMLVSAPVLYYNRDHF